MAYSIEDYMSMSEQIYQDQQKGSVFIDGHNPPWTVLEVCNDEKLFGSGMYACLVDTGDGNCSIVFRGTKVENGLDLLQDVVFADAGLLNNGETAQQEMARAFTKQIYDKYKDQFNEFTFVGHSLGGNLAEHAAITAPDGMRINSNAISLDGPGFSLEYLEAHKNQISEMRNKLDRYQWSFVGAFLHSPDGEQYQHLNIDGIQMYNGDPEDLKNMNVLDLTKLLVDYELNKHVAYDKIKNGEYHNGEMLEKDILYSSRIFDLLTHNLTDQTLVGRFFEDYCSGLEHALITRPIGLPLFGTPLNLHNESFFTTGPADFRVNTVILESAATDLDNMLQKLDAIKEDLLSVRLKLLPFQIFSRANILGLSSRLHLQSAKCRQMISYLHDISDTYNAHEQKCLDNARSASTNNSNIPWGSLLTHFTHRNIEHMDSGKTDDPAQNSSSSGTHITRTHGDNSSIIETDPDGNVTVHNLSDQEQDLFSTYRSKGFTDEEIWNIIKQHRNPDGTLDYAGAVGALSAMNEDRIMQNLTDMRARMKDLTRRKPDIPSNYEGMCGDLAVDQLRQQGLLPENVDYSKDTGLNYCDGKTLADRISKSDSNHVNGVEYRNYSTFEKMLKENPEPITNIVCSWDQGGDFGSKHGHAMLISRIENGMVYFMDNRGTSMPPNPPQRTADSNTPQCLSLDDFQKHYLDKNKFTGATVCKRKPAAEGPTCPL